MKLRTGQTVVFEIEQCTEEDARLARLIFVKVQYNPDGHTRAALLTNLPQLILKESASPSKLYLQFYGCESLDCLTAQPTDSKGKEEEATSNEGTPWHSAMLPPDRFSARMREAILWRYEHTVSRSNSNRPLSAEEKEEEALKAEGEEPYMANREQLERHREEVSALAQQPVPLTQLEVKAREERVTLRVGVPGRRRLPIRYIIMRSCSGECKFATTSRMTYLSCRIKFGPNWWR